jgi:hypothetical protein
MLHSTDNNVLDHNSLSGKVKELWEYLEATALKLYIDVDSGYMGIDVESTPKVDKELGEYDLHGTKTSLSLLIDDNMFYARMIQSIFLNRDHLEYINSKKPLINKVNLLSLMYKKCSNQDKIMLFKLTNGKNYYTLDNFYSLLTTCASISNPIMSLDLAVESLGVILPESDLSEWGPKAKSIVLPPIESLGDSSFWIAISFIGEKYGLNIIHNTTNSTMMPSYDNTSASKDEVLLTIWRRIIELGQAPQSATFRKNCSDKRDKIKNAIDYYIIEAFRGRTEVRDNYKNLSLASEYLKSGRIETRQTLGNKQLVSYKSVLLNYLEGSCLHGEIYKVYKIITKLLHKMALSISDSHQLSKSIYQTPSRAIIDCFRKGPVRKTGKNKNTRVTYLPFTFLKSHKYDNIAVTERKSYASVVERINKFPSTINNFSISTANAYLPLYKEFIHKLYTLSDICKKEIEINQRMINPSILDTCLYNLIHELEVASDKDVLLKNTIFDNLPIGNYMEISFIKEKVEDKNLP